ncbi:NADP-dependent malic enzyme [Vitis vinifera]|uniref:NADP-dependent malic enzyme n=1 Tax=Vitis vinifera TaxID=29760 RepID=A0A438GBM3_VITVI|nr:NADP-dependent malic enzyme [Vitis vinifera]
MLKPSPNGHLLPVPLGPILAVYSLSTALISAVIFIGTFFSAAVEIRDTRWFWRRSKTPLQWLLCFPLGTQPLEASLLLVIRLLPLSLPPHVPHILHHIRTSGYTLLRDPHHNKGLAFTEKERDAHYLRGLLPPAVLNQDLQEKRLMHNLRQYKVPLQSEAEQLPFNFASVYILQKRNERLFYKLLIDNVKELLPVVYTPTVGEACQKYRSIFKRPQGLYISLKEKAKILEVLKNWPERSIQVVVVTDSERILGLGDLGCKYMLVPLVLKSAIVFGNGNTCGKTFLYTTLGGIHPSICLPVTIDVGTNNDQLLKDEFYIGLKQRRATGQGTTYVVLARLIASLKLVDGSLAEHTFLFLGAGKAGTGIAELIALEISKQTKAPLEETRKKIWLVNSKVVET